MITWMEDQPKGLLEVLWDFCDSGDVISLAKRDSTSLPSSCTQISKIGFYIMLRQLKKYMPFLNKQNMKKMKRANPKVFEELAKLKYGLKKTSPMKGGLQMVLLDKFLLAVDLARGELTSHIDVDVTGKIDMQRLGIWGFAKIADGANTSPK